MCCSSCRWNSPSRRRSSFQSAWKEAWVNLMAFLEVKNLHVEVEDKKILNGLTLTVEKGQVAAIMGPNGSGKSTLAYVLAGKDNYKVTEGDVLLNGDRKSTRLNSSHL